MMSHTGILYIVATPIGNLGDITLRAIETLKAVDTIVAEDTRNTKHLLTALGIVKPISSLHTHNERQKTVSLIQVLEKGQSIALVSDAGTPLIQDPGFPLVKAAIQAKIPIVPIPGPCALITALCASGVGCDSFLFAGFLPAKSPARQERLAGLKNNTHTLIFYESTHRIQETIQDIETVFGSDYEFVLAKELTKTFEQFIRGNTHTITEFFKADPAHIKGEFVLILPPIEETKSSLDEDEKLLSVLLKELPLKQAVNLAEKLSSSSKNTLYKQALALQSKK